MMQRVFTRDLVDDRTTKGSEKAGESR